MKPKPEQKGIECKNCGGMNKPDAKFCKKCGRELAEIIPWKPTWKWHLKVLIIIYVTLVAVFFLLNWLLAPYLRDIPKDITPWLR